MRRNRRDFYGLIMAFIVWFVFVMALWYTTSAEADGPIRTKLILPIVDEVITERC